MRTTETACHGATVTTIPIMEDNYAYIIARQRQCVVVDPGLAPPVAEYLTRRELTLCAILNTHQHGDHTGGNRALIKAFGGKLIGGTRQHGVDRHMADGETLIIADLSIQCIDTPGHTADSVCFHLPEHDALFSGDTLFCCGCGRPFGGAPETLWHSLLRLRHLPGNTQIFCGHEYTLENIAFALTIEPGNPQLPAYQQTAQTRLAAQTPSVPTLLSDEINVNPFLRADTPTLPKTLNCPHTTPEHIFTTLRQKKNRF